MKLTQVLKEEKIDMHDYQLKLAIRKAILSVTLTWILYGPVIFLGLSFLPTNYTSYIETSYVVLIIFVLGLYVGFRNYREYKDLFSHVNAINMIKDGDFPLGEFKHFSLTYNSYKENLEKKLDLLKMYSPFSLLAYGAGLIIEDKAKLKTIPGINVSFTLSEIMSVCGLILSVVFVFWIQRTYSKYKYFNQLYIRYESEFIRYEERLKGINEIRNIREHNRRRR